eukprot:6654383-Alexandrium_andersonii.AAC.1
MLRADVEQGTLHHEQARTALGRGVVVTTSYSGQGTAEVALSMLSSSLRLGSNIKMFSACDTALLPRT